MSWVVNEAARSARTKNMWLGKGVFRASKSQDFKNWTLLPWFYQRSNYSSASDPVRGNVNQHLVINSLFSKTTGWNEFLKYPVLMIVLLLQVKDNTVYSHHHLRQHHIRVLQWFRLLLGPNKMETRESFIQDYRQNMHCFCYVFLSALLAFTCLKLTIEIS